MPPPPPFEVIMPEIESRSRRHYSRLPAAAPRMEHTDLCPAGIVSAPQRDSASRFSTTALISGSLCAAQ